jgi:hypothetical protein
MITSLDDIRHDLWMLHQKYPYACTLHICIEESFDIKLKFTIDLVLREPEYIMDCLQGVYVDNYIKDLCLSRQLDCEVVINKKFFKHKKEEEVCQEYTQEQQIKS